MFVLFTRSGLKCKAYDASIMMSRIKLLFKLFTRLLASKSRMQILCEHTTASIYSEICVLQVYYNLHVRLYVCWSLAREIMIILCQHVIRSLNDRIYSNIFKLFPCDVILLAIIYCTSIVLELYLRADYILVINLLHFIIIIVKPLLIE